MIKTHMYDNGMIVEFSPYEFMAAVENRDGDIETKTLSSLEKAKYWIDSK